MRNLVELEQLNPRQFERFRALVYDASGIRINDNKLSLLSNRIRRRLKAGEFAGFDAYYSHLTSPEGAGEIEHFIDAVTTNETFFFRTPAHFDWFREEFIGGLVTAERAGGREKSVRIWSAGCATGAEPYTLAIILLENMFRLRDWSLSITASDISEAALRAARDGTFRPRAVEAVSERQRRRYFEAVPGDEERWRIRPVVGDLVEFRPHNLMNPVPWPPFDCVFIRNVLIYFDRASKTTVVENLIDALAPGGFLVVGPSEGIYDMLDPLERRTPFLYRKPGGAGDDGEGEA
jgi:chemotaxis protein methyltransferase CheR